MTPTKPRPFLVALATAVASQDGVVAAGDSVRNLPTRLGAEQRLLPGVGHPVSGHLSVVEDLPAERVPIHQAWRGEGKPQGLPTKRSPPGWAGHIMQFRDDHWTRAVTDWIPRDVKRLCGRPPTRWSDFVKTLNERFEALPIPGASRCHWATLARDRDK
ncbi:F-box only protein 36 isoform X3 [Sorex araneus]|uniref:F-box only protein 36 isoform X3 n=1 Tax=Sorex araneus TaxID=42254 RepID=UPI0024337FC7|nr:F-box only protein 36 isoform X3 [Sorex araneus]